jgi:hypothetical protein
MKKSLGILPFPQKESQMSKFNVFSKFLWPLLLLGLLLGIGVGFVLAGRSDNAEGGQERPIDKTLSRSDEEVIEAETAPQLGDFQVDGEGQADTADSAVLVEEVELQVNPEAAQAQFFKRAAGSNFQPRDSTATFSYSGSGCMQRNSNVGDSWFTIDLQVPEGAIIDFLRVYYYDNNGTYDINSELWAFDGAGGTTLLAEADSSGTPGFSSAGSGFFSHTVDSLNESLVVVASIQGGVGSDLQLCGIRLRYQYTPLAANFLPSVLNLTAP